MNPLFIGALVPLFLVAGESVGLLYSLRGQSPRRRIAVLLFPVSQVVLVIQAILAGIWYGLGDALLLLAIVLGSVCAVVNIPLILLILHAERRDEERALKHAAERQLAYQKEHLKRSRSVAEQAVEARRRWAERFEEIARALETGDHDRAEELIAGARGLVAPPQRFCDHPAVDALLASKAAECTDRSISFVVDAVLPRVLAFDDVELCALLSNAVDNAMRACEVLSKDARWVRVGIWIRAGLIVLDITNSYAADIENEGVVRAERCGSQRDATRHSVRLAVGESGIQGLPEHGWGTSIMRSIVKRRGGEFICTQNAGVWQAKMTLPLREAE